MGKVFGAEAPLGGFVRGQKHFGEATVRTEALWEAPSEVRSTLGRVFLRKKHFGSASFGDKSIVGKASAVGKNTFGGSFVRG